MSDTITRSEWERLPAWEQGAKLKTHRLVNDAPSAPQALKAGEIRRSEWETLPPAEKQAALRTRRLVD